MRPRKGIPKVIADEVQCLELKANHHALLVLLDKVTPFVEFRCNSSNAFLDSMIKWRRTELPALYNSEVEFFIATGCHKKAPLIKRELFPLYKKQINK
jgi:hypothetical protein